MKHRFFQNTFAPTLFSAAAAISVITSTPAQAAEPPPAATTQQQTDPSLDEARLELQKRLKEAYAPVSHSLYSRILSVQAYAEQVPALAPEAIQGLGNLFKHAPVSEWPDIIEIIARIAYLDLAATEHLAEALITRTTEDAMKLLDIDNRALRLAALAVMAKGSLYIPGLHSKTFPHFYAALRNASPEGEPAAHIVTEFLTLYCQDVVIPDPEAELTPFYDALKDRMDAQLARHQTIKARKDALIAAEQDHPGSTTGWNEIDQALLANEEAINASTRAYGYVAARLPEKAGEAQQILETLIPTDNHDAYSFAFAALMQIAVKRPELARGLVDKMRTYSRNPGYEYAAFNVMSAIGRTHEEHTGYVLDALMQEATTGDMFRALDSVRDIAKAKPEAQRKVIHRRMMDFLLDEFKKGDPQRFGNALHFMRQEAQANNSFAAAWVAAIKTLSDQDLTSWRLIDEILIIGTKLPQHRADALELLTRLLNKNVRDQNFELAQNLVANIRKLESMEPPRTNPLPQRSDAAPVPALAP